MLHIRFLHVLTKCSFTILSSTYWDFLVKYCEVLVNKSDLLISIWRGMKRVMQRCSVILLLADPRSLCWAVLWMTPIAFIYLHSPRSLSPYPRFFHPAQMLNERVKNTWSGECLPIARCSLSRACYKYRNVAQVLRCAWSSSNRPQLLSLHRTRLCAGSMEGSCRSCQSLSFDISTVTPCVLV